MYPHNFFLNIWSELGLLGVVAILWLGVVLVWHRTRRLTVMLVLTALIVHGLVDVPYFKNDLALIFWFVVAFVV